MTGDDDAGGADATDGTGPQTTAPRRRPRAAPNPCRLVDAAMES